MTQNAQTSRIDDLIQQHCPDGVKFLAFTDVGTFTRGGGPQKKDFIDHGVGCIHYGQIYTHYGVHAEFANAFVSQEVAARSRLAHPGDVIIADTSENDEDLAKSVAWLGDEPVAVSNHTLIYTSELNPKFVSYYLRSAQFDREKRRYIMGTKVRTISGNAFSKLRIPVPPLPVQEEIVRILDTFTQLEAELEAELEARRQQYDLYRASMLRGGSSEPSVELGEIFEMRAGVHVKAAEISDHQTADYPYPCFGGNGLRGYVSEFNQDSEITLLVGRQGALCGNVHRVRGKFYATEHAVVVTPRGDVDMNWAFHALTHMNLNQYKTKSAQPGLAVGKIKALQASFPQLEEQGYVASTLDKFDALVNDLSVGLPAEIVARRQQYEHYRDRLLSFRELSA